jgi:RimJ/RimL family protein N-acetyltransferase
LINEGVDPMAAELRTERLLLRAWRDEDLEPYAALNADPRVMEHFPSLLTRAESDASAERIRRLHEERGFTVWAVEVLDSERGPTDFVGFTGLSVPSFELPFPHLVDPPVEVGWRLAADWWGLGIASEAAAASLAYAWDVLDLPEVLSWTTPANTRSQAVMRRIGMTYAGHFEHPLAAPDAWWRRHVVYRATSATRHAPPSRQVDADARRQRGGARVDARHGTTGVSGRNPV